MPRSSAVIQKPGPKKMALASIGTLNKPKPSVGHLMGNKIGSSL